MKTKLYLSILISLLTASTVNAQNYNPIVIGNTSLFQSETDDHLYAMHIDSSKTDAGKQSFYFLKTISYDSDNNCYAYEYEADWTGTKLLKDGNEYYFFNNLSDSFKLAPTKELNDTWRLFTYPNDDYIEATITATEIESFLTLSDSVKTVSLQVKNISGTNISSTLNAKTIKISKNYGIIKIPVFNNFPSTYTAYELAGLSNPAIGYQLLTSRKIYNFAIGDEFHYEEAASTLPEIYSIKRVLKITGKSISSNTDTIKYTYNDYSETTTTYYTFPPNNAILYSNASTTYTKKYVVNDSISYPVRRRILDDNLLQQISLHADESQNGRLTQIVDSIAIGSYDSGCGSAIVDAPNHTELLEGVGILYHNIGSFMPSNERLVYYKKGSETWGIPLTLATYSKRNNAAFSLFPNPLKQGEQLHFETTNFQAKQVSIYNITGNKVLESDSPSEIQTVDVSQLQSGLYLIQLINSTNEFISSKFIIK